MSRLLAVIALFSACGSERVDPVPTTAERAAGTWIGGYPPYEAPTRERATELTLAADGTTTIVATGESSD